MNLPLSPLLAEEPTPEPTTSEPTPEPTETSSPEPSPEPEPTSDSEESPTSDEPPESFSALYEPTTSECGVMETSQDYCLHLTPDTVTFVGSGLLLLVLLLSALLASQLRRP